MSYTKEFVYPLIPIVFELVVRIFVLKLDNFLAYVNPATILITFSIWSALTSVRVPRGSRIGTDLDYIRSLESAKSILSTLAMIGFICFGGSVVSDVVTSGYPALLGAVRMNLQGLFVTVSILHAIMTTLYIAVNRQTIEDLVVV